MATVVGKSPKTEETRRNRRIVAAAAITAVGGLLFGYDTGVVSGALLFLKDDFGGLSNLQQELVTSLLLVGAMAGALLAGRIADKVGRRKTVLGTALVFVVGVLLAAFTPTYPVLLIARIIIGLAVGSASMVVPLYIGEFAPPKVRGALVSLNQLAITVGILVSYLVDYGLANSGNWRLMFGLAGIPAVVLFVGMLFQHESPHWLVEHGREDEARNVLRQLREPDKIDSEVAEVKEIRRPLLISGTIGMAAGMIITAIAFIGTGDHLHGAHAIAAIAGLVIYTGSFAIGLGPVFWLMISEIYPLRIRGAAMSVASTANWGANFIVTISFLTLLSAIGGTGVFFLFGFLTLAALYYFFRQVPETKGRSLQAIERDVRGLPPPTAAVGGSEQAGPAGQ